MPLPRPYLPDRWLYLSTFRLELSLWRGRLLPLGAAAAIQLNAACLTLLDGCTGTAAPSSASKLARHRGGSSPTVGLSIGRWQLMTQAHYFQAALTPVARELAPARWRSRRHTTECGLPGTLRWLYWDGCAVQREQARSPQGIFTHRWAFIWQVAADDPGTLLSGNT